MDVEKIIQTNAPLPLRQRSVIHLILVSNRISETVSHALKPFGVSPQQFNVLRILRGQKGRPANLNTLSERMVSRMSNTTRLVDKLLEKGYVSRTVCPSNRRKVEILLTEAGAVALRDMDRVVNEAEEKLMQPLADADLRKLNALLDLIH